MVGDVTGTSDADAAVVAIGANPEAAMAILNVLLETLAAMSTSVVAYWVGSSAGSAEKTTMPYNSTPVK